MCDIVYLTLGAFPRPSQPVKQGVSTCGEVLSFIYYSWGLVFGFFVHPVMLTVTILYCTSSNPHPIIFLHL